MKTISAAEFRAASVPKERDVVKAICHALQLAGYTTPRVAANLSDKERAALKGVFMRAGQRNALYGGSDEGVPDLLVWKIGRDLNYVTGEIVRRGGKWQSFEIKRCDPATKDPRPSARGRKIAHVSEEQKYLADVGAVHIVWNAEQVLRVLGES